MSGGGGADGGTRSRTDIDPASAEAARLRAARDRRGPVEAALATNPGQRALVAERDDALASFLRRPDGPLDRILDLGCGDGAPLAMLRARGIITAGVGLDLLPERVREAATTWPGIEFMVGDAAELPFDDAAFDAVLAMTVLSSIADERRRRRVLSEVARVLRPGGRFVWYDMRRGNPRNPDVRPFTHVDVRAALPAWPAAFRTVTLLPPLARRLGPFTRALYPVGAAVPILRTHEVGRASKPEGIRSNATSSPGQLRPGRA